MRRLLVPTLVLAGLISGFAREVLLAYFFGVSNDIEIFRVAFGLPSIISDGLAVSFAAILIRLLVRGERRKPAQVLHRAVWSTVVFSFGVFLFGVLTMPWQARLLAPGMQQADHDLLTLAGRFCWLMFLLVMLSLPLRALMSTRGRVWPGAASPLMRSGGFILFLLIFVVVFNWRDLMAPVIATAMGGAAVLGVHLLVLGRRDRRRVLASLAVLPRPTDLAPTLGAIGLVLVSQLFLSAGRILDRAVSSGMGEGTLAGLEYSYALLMAIAAILATSSNLTLAPGMGRAIHETGRLARSHIVHIATIFAFAAVIGVVLSLAAEPIIRLILERGAFDRTATTLTASIFRLHALGLGPLVLALLLTQVLLLHGRQRIALAAAGIKTGVKLVALWLVARNDGDIVDVAATLIWAELAMAAVLLVVMSLPRRKL